MRDRGCSTFDVVVRSNDQLLRGVSVADCAAAFPLKCTKCTRRVLITRGVG